MSGDPLAYRCLGSLYFCEKIVIMLEFHETFKVEFPVGFRLMFPSIFFWKLLLQERYYQYRQGVLGHSQHEQVKEEEMVCNILQCKFS